MSHTGVLHREKLEELLQIGFIGEVGKRYLNPSSIDLPLEAEAYQIDHVFLPPPGCNIHRMLSERGATRHDLQKPLERGLTYLIKIAGTWQLPKTVYAYANPKSSSGRIGLSVRIIADGVPMYDALTAGWHGQIWAIVRPEMFPVLVQPGIALSQFRLFDGKSFLSELEIEMAIHKHGLLFNEFGEKIENPPQHRGSLHLSVKVANEMLGWVCNGSDHVLDLSRSDHEPGEFFKPLYGGKEGLIIYPGSLYIVPTRERVKVPAEFCAELREVDVRVGRFAAHAAGFIDSGWGCGSGGEAPGQQLTLEINPFEVICLMHGQFITRLRYEKMIQPPVNHYGTSASNYVIRSGMGAGLAKFFKKT
jgi:dCTP deaminase